MRPGVRRSGCSPGALRARVLKAVGARAGIAGAEVGLVSVVVVVEPGDRVEDCLASVRAQSHGLLEVLVCPVGPVSAELPDDPRFRAGPPADTWYAAANGGIAATLGDYVVLVRGCDQLLPHAVEALAGSLASSGSAVATGVLEQVGEPERWLQRAQADSHGAPSSGRPAQAEQAADLALANKAFTRDVARTLRLVETDDWLCSPTLAHLLPAATVDVLDRPVVRWAHGRGHRAYGARPSPLPLLEDALLRRDLVDRVRGRVGPGRRLAPPLVRRPAAALRRRRGARRRGHLAPSGRARPRAARAWSSGPPHGRCCGWPARDAATPWRRSPPSSRPWATTSRPS